MERPTKFVLPFLSLWAVYAVFEFSYRNGFIALLQQSVRDHALPETEEPLRSDLTGLRFLDEILALIILFFWPVADGSMPGLSLHALNFLGAGAASWVLVYLESLRVANQYRLVTFVSVFGLLVQTISFAVTIPIYLALHLFTSPIGSRPTRDSILVSPLELKLVPFSFMAGYIIPSALVFLPETFGGPLRGVQQRIAFWQAWPIWISIVQFTLSKIFSTWLRSSRPGQRDSVSNARETLSCFRHVYAFAFACAAIPHIASWSISFSALAFPAIFDVDIVSSLQPRNVFLNTLPWLPARPQSIGEGTLWFLQWDQLIGSIALLLWSIALYTSAHSVVRVGVGCFELAPKVVLLCLLAGPSGAAVELIWERDELLLQGGRKAVEATKK